MTMFRIFAVLIVLGLAVGCEDRPLRGSVRPSPDGQTFLIVADDNGGACDRVLVDGKPWPHPVGEAGPIAPGPHSIACPGRVDFVIEAGTIFTFDYWGP